MKKYKLNTQLDAGKNWENGRKIKWPLMTSNFGQYFWTKIFEKLFKNAIFSKIGSKKGWFRVNIGHYGLIRDFSHFLKSNFLSKNSSVRIWIGHFRSISVNFVNIGKILVNSGSFFVIFSHFYAFSGENFAWNWNCLLYTSDAADE